MKIETVAIHAANKGIKNFGSVIQPIELSTTFFRDENGDYPSGYGYARANNPNREQLEICIAALENGEKAIAFSSGMAACSAILQTLKPGDHVIIPDDVYHGVSQLFLKVFSGWNLEYSAVNMNNIPLLLSEIKGNTKLMWIESPSNPKLNIYDYDQLLKICHEHQIISVCDNTFATPILQQPLNMGADVVMHSSTKYLGGHSDVTGGVLVFKSANTTYEKAREVQQLGGAVPSPFDCFLTLRGIKTLSYRMKGHCQNALLVATFLNNHPEIETVFYPGLPSHLNYELAKKQMTDFGGMLSITLKKGENAARKLAAGCKLFAQATSLGGVESLIEHRASVEPAGTKTPLNLVRISVGLEHADDLIEDLKLALESI